MNAGQATQKATFSLSRNAKVVDCDFDSKTFLLNLPRGAYTTARTVNLHSVFEFETHIERTASSCREIFKDAEIEGGPAAAAAAAELGDPARLRPRVVAGLRAAVAHFQETCPPELAGRELKLTVLATLEPAEGGEGAGAYSGGGGGGGGAGGVEPAVYCHAGVLPPIPARPVKVEVRGQPRGNALAKDSGWVRERRALEDLVAPDANEMVLAGEGGALYEGGQTNFYAVVGGAVHTAGEGVLEGTVRRLLLEVCARAGVPVVLAPPRAGDLLGGGWEGALVSSTSRLALPVDQVDLPREGERMRPGVDPSVRFDYAPPPSSSSAAVEEGEGAMGAEGAGAYAAAAAAAACVEEEGEGGGAAAAASRLGPARREGLALAEWLAARVQAEVEAHSTRILPP